MQRSLTVPARVESLPQIAQFVLGAADEAGLDAKSRYGLRLAIDELATNSIVYGYANTSLVQPEVVVLVDHCDGGLCITIEDRGVPFDPSQAPPPDDLGLPAEERKIGGLGIYLALQSVDEYSYERVGDRNRSVLVVRRKAATGAG